MAEKDYPEIFHRLKKILKTYESDMRVIEDAPESYYLNANQTEKHKNDLFFAAVAIKKTNVKFHLMPVYMYPDLLDGVSPELKKRMQGKSCFNFSKPDELLFLELEKLVQAGFQRLKSEGDVV